MSQSRTRFLGMEVHKETMAVAYGAPEHGAAVTSCGTSGTRQSARDTRSRTRPSQAQPRIFLDAAGPGGSWLSRSLQQQDDDGGGVAPSLRPTKAGDRVTTDRRDAGPRARLARAGDRTPVEVLTVAEEASRDLTRARDETIRARHDAPCRLQAVVLRQDIREAGRAHGGPAPRRGLSDVVWPTPAQPSVLPAYVRAVQEPTARLGRLEHARRAHGQSWRVPPVVDALQALRLQGEVF